MLILFTILQCKFENIEGLLLHIISCYTINVYARTEYLMGLSNKTKFKNILGN